MNIEPIRRKPFWGQYLYRVSVISYKVLKPVTCCPHHTIVNHKPVIDYNRKELVGHDTKLRRNHNHYRNTSVFFNDLDVLDNLVDAEDLLVYNCVKCNEEYYDEN